jgi:hypothetical protein
MFIYSFGLTVSGTEGEAKVRGSACFPVGSRNRLYFSGHMPCFPGERFPLGSTDSERLLVYENHRGIRTHLEFFNESLVGVVIEVITVGIQIFRKSSVMNLSKELSIFEGSGDSPI